MRSGFANPARWETLMDYECRTISSVATMSTSAPGDLQSGYCHKFLIGLTTTGS
jgi:hypothetical protein